MTATRFRRATTALIASAALATLLAATAPRPQDQGQAQFTPYQPPVLTVEFEGGTVRDYVAVLRTAGEDINIMLDSEAGDLPLPAVELRKVMLLDALMILEDLEPADESYELSLDEFMSGPAELTSPVYRIVARKQRPPQPPLQTSVWSVSTLIGRGTEAAHILGAIETALALQEDLGAPEVRFHEETGLILARAHPEQIATIGEVIHNLQSAASPERTEGDRERQHLAMSLEQTRGALESMEMRAAQSEAMARNLERENERLRARVEILTEELERLRGADQSEDSGG